MDKDTLRTFIRWLDNRHTSEQEILDRKQEFLDMLAKVSSHEAKVDIKLGLRLMDEELVARFGLYRERKPK
ncbi:MAG: hypothetical protein OEW08_11660 [Gammaproteobacteria bacterium]|nr:hypothetical protein [Gammaproteobacteria bacterium]